MKVKSTYLILLTLLILPLTGFSEPLVTSISPADQSNDVERDVRIKVDFDTKVKPWSVNLRTFKVKDSKGELVVGKIRVNKNKNRAIFTPEQPLNMLETYKVILNRGIRDLSNERLARQVFQFTVRDGQWQGPVVVNARELGLIRRGPSPRIATSSNEAASIIWRYYDDVQENFNILVNHFNTSTASWEDEELIGNGGTSHNIILDPVGNKFAIWSNYNRNTNYTEISSRYYDASINIWESVKTTGVSGSISRLEASMDKSGNVIAMWTQFDGNRSNLWSNRYNASLGSWETSQLIENSSATVSFYQMALDMDGNAVAIWWLGGNGINIWANRFDAATGLWGAETLVESNDSNAIVSDQQMTLDSYGNALVVWERSGKIWSTSFDVISGTWSASKSIDNTEGLIFNISELVMNSNGNAFIAWQRSGSIWSSSFDLGTGWSAPKLVYSGPAGGDIKLAIDTDGNALAVWEHPIGLGSNRFNRNVGEWDNAVFIQNDQSGGTLSDLVMDLNGNGLITWIAGSSDGFKYNIWGARFNSVVGWGVPQQLGQNDLTPYSPSSVQTVIDTDGNIFTTWVERSDDGYEIWSNHFK